MGGSGVDEDRASVAQSPANVVIVKHTGLTLSLIEKLQQESYDCKVCLEKVKQVHSIWSCSVCYSVFHHSCISEWARGEEEEQWRCPGCQSQLAELPAASCFCGRVSTPSESHSCSFACSKRRKCEHTCTMACHPGPCPPCPVPGLVIPCHCGGSATSMPCGVTEGMSCNKVCGRTLPCGHECRDRCHPGSCVCRVVCPQQCYCGEVIEARVCSSPLEGGGTFACRNSCPKTKSCGSHLCGFPCHPGRCPPCSLQPTATTARACACGASQNAGAPRLSCLDPQPLCDARCSRTLKCGHRCRRRCHAGMCSECGDEVLIQCRCGNSYVQIECAKAAAIAVAIAAGENSVDLPTCKTVCNELRSCGKHRCNKVCCSRDEHSHTCLLVCSKMKHCGVHNCGQLCHSGRCGECLDTQFTEATCPCGLTITPPPIACGESLLLCDNPCTRERACGHTGGHTCHYEGECTPCWAPVKSLCDGGHIAGTYPCGGPRRCYNTCGKTLACGHVCARSCHGGPCLPDSSPCQRACKEVLGCGHVCDAPCHTGNACPPCSRTVTWKCDCGVATIDASCGQACDVPVCGNECAAAASNVHVDEASLYPGRVCLPFPSSLLACAVTSVEEVRYNERVLASAAKHSGPMRHVNHGRLHAYILEALAPFYAVEVECKRDRITLQPSPESARPLLLLSRMARFNLQYVVPLTKVVCEGALTASEEEGSAVLSECSVERLSEEAATVVQPPGHSVDLPIDTTTGGDDATGNSEATGLLCLVPPRVTSSNIFEAVGARKPLVQWIGALVCLIDFPSCEECLAAEETVKELCTRVARIPAEAYREDDKATKKFPKTKKKKGMMKAREYQPPPSYSVTNLFSVLSE